MFDYTKKERFAVVRKLQKNRRYYCNFKQLHETREAAEAAIASLVKEQGGRYYVVGIQRISSSTIRSKKDLKNSVKKEEKPLETQGVAV